jgi:hypothetical protein
MNILGVKFLIYYGFYFFLLTTLRTKQHIQFCQPAFLILKRKWKVGLCDHHAVCVSSPHKLLNAWISRYKTRYLYHGTWDHLNGVLHKSLPSVCGIYVCIHMSFLGNGSVTARSEYRSNNRRIVGRVVRVVSKESMRLLLPRTSYFSFIFSLENYGVALYSGLHGFNWLITKSQFYTRH